MSSEEKTEKPTAKKIEDATKKGNRLRSSLISNVISTVAIALVAAVVGPYIFSSVSNSSSLLFSSVGTSPTGAYQWILRIIVVPFGVLIAGIACVSFLSVFANILLTHGIFAPALESVQPKISNLNPGGKIKKMLGAKTWYELIRNLLFLTICIAIACVVVYSRGRDLYATLSANGTHIAVVLGRMLFVALSLLFAASILFAFADRALMKMFWLKGLKMAKSEVKREYIQSEGDPRIKSQRRGIANEAARARERFDLSNINFALADASGRRLLGFCYAPEQLERPVVLMKIVGADFSEAMRRLSDAGVATVLSTDAVSQMFAKSRAQDYVPKGSAAYVESLIASVQE